MAGLVVGEVCNTSELEVAGGVHVGVRGGGVDQATALPTPYIMCISQPRGHLPQAGPILPSRKGPFLLSVFERAGASLHLPCTNTHLNYAAHPQPSRKTAIHDGAPQL